MSEQDPTRRSQMQRLDAAIVAERCAGLTNRLERLQTKHAEQAALEVVPRAFEDARRRVTGGKA